MCGRYTEVTAKGYDSAGVLPISLSSHLATRVTVKLVDYRLALPNCTGHRTSSHALKESGPAL